MATKKEINILADDAEKISKETNRRLSDAIWAALDQHNITLNAHLRGDIYRLVKKECDLRKNSPLTRKQIKDLTDAALRACSEQNWSPNTAIWSVITKSKLTRDPKLMYKIYTLLRNEFDLRNASSAGAKVRRIEQQEYTERHQPRLF